MGRRAVCSLLALWMVSGCEKVTAENIQKWKGTQKGPGKLEQAFRNPKLDPRLRAEAAIALADIDLHVKVTTGFPALPEADRAQLAAQLIPLQAARIEKGKDAESVAARDILYEVRASLNDEQRRQADVVLTLGVERDLRSAKEDTQSRHTVAKVATTLGPTTVGPAITKVLGDGAAPFARATALAKTLDNQALRDKAAAALAKRAAKQDALTPALAKALCELGGSEAWAALQAKIRAGSETEALVAAQALRATTPTPEIAPAALEAAADPKTPRAARDELFGLLEGMRGPSVAAGLVKMIARGDVDETTRFRAFQAIVVADKGPAVFGALEAFPATATYEPDAIAELLVKPIVALGQPARQAALSALLSTSALARLVAVQTLAEVGTGADASEVAKQSGDRTILPGLPKGSTVGKEAARVAKLLKARPKEAAAANR